jgi:D-beta-D-heptose 7-phosphate kinase/D-beta-D-heptose 1-phosphate adenosyltransferase|tara:strand:+ start:119 stop:517 length:399 start_codon:yes stop_codon:yes gene_type:complete
MKISFVNGCFDVLHPGHIEMLKYARSSGDYLIVAIDSDRKVAEMKGPERPIFPQHDRALMLKAIRYVDVVHIFDTKEDLEQLLESIQPDIMVIGSDWKGKEVVGSQYAKSVRFFDRIGGYSTTKTIQGSSYR